MHGLLHDNKSFWRRSGPTIGCWRLVIYDFFVCFIAYNKISVDVDHPHEAGFHRVHIVGVHAAVSVQVEFLELPYVGDIAVEDRVPHVFEFVEIDMCDGPIAVEVQHAHVVRAEMHVHQGPVLRIYPSILVEVGREDLRVRYLFLRLIREERHDALDLLCIRLRPSAVAVDVNCPDPCFFHQYGRRLDRTFHLEHFNLDIGDLGLRDSNIEVVYLAVVIIIYRSDRIFINDVALYEPFDKVSYLAGFLFLDFPVTVKIDDPFHPQGIGQQVTVIAIYFLIAVDITSQYHILRYAQSVSVKYLDNTFPVAVVHSPVAVYVNVVRLDSREQHIIVHVHHAIGINIIPETFLFGDDLALRHPLHDVFEHYDIVPIVLFNVAVAVLVDVVRSVCPPCLSIRLRQRRFVHIKYAVFIDILRRVKYAVAVHIEHAVAVYVIPINIHHRIRQLRIIGALDKFHHVPQFVDIGVAYFAVIVHVCFGAMIDPYERIRVGIRIGKADDHPVQLIQFDLSISIPVF